MVFEITPRGLRTVEMCRRVMCVTWWRCPCWWQDAACRLCMSYGAHVPTALRMSVCAWWQVRGGQCDGAVGVSEYPLASTIRQRHWPLALSCNDSIGAAVTVWVWQLRVVRRVRQLHYITFIYIHVPICPCVRTSLAFRGGALCTRCTSRMHVSCSGQAAAVKEGGGWPFVEVPAAWVCSGVR